MCAFADFYYALTSLKIRCPWKKSVTTAQITQVSQRAATIAYPSCLSLCALHSFSSGSLSLTLLWSTLRVSCSGAWSIFSIDTGLTVVGHVAQSCFGRLQPLCTHLLPPGSPRWQLLWKRIRRMGWHCRPYQLPVPVHRVSPAFSWHRCSRCAPNVDVYVFQ